jgi:hypothetical protein
MSRRMLGGGKRVMSERRQEQRQWTLKTAKIKSLDIWSDIDCAILDISDGGARILLPVGVDPPDTFDLAVDPDGQAKLCRVVWKSGNRIGVSFQSKVML